MRLSYLAQAGLMLFSLCANAAFDGAFYHQRYGLNNIYDKVVDNHGNGREELYGVRNFREVLKGVVYRGGANNLYHRDHPRDNSNPLPTDGLNNLCEEGFQNAVYLYAKNFDKAPPRVQCHSIRGENRLHYSQLHFIEQSRAILELMHDAILDPSKGPVYVHCWNGWHASGMVSAFALRQFCGFSGNQAVAYWTRNADGTDHGGYESIKRRIRDFRPYSDLQIDAATRARICP